MGMILRAGAIDPGWHWRPGHRSEAYPTLRSVDGGHHGGAVFVATHDDFHIEELSCRFKHFDNLRRRRFSGYRCKNDLAANGIQTGYRRERAVLLVFKCLSIKHL